MVENRTVVGLVKDKRRSVLRNAINEYSFKKQQKKNLILESWPVGK